MNSRNRGIQGSVRRATVAHSVRRGSTATAKRKVIETIKPNFAVGKKEVRYETESLMFLGTDNVFRQFFVRLILHPWFDRFVLLVIFLNSILFAIADYSVVDVNGNLVAQNSLRNKIVIQSNVIFVVFFAVEMAFKIIAMGFVGSQGSYMGDWWNWLDGSVVVTGIVILVDPNIPNITMFRVIRMLRPLRTISAMPSLQNIVLAIVTALPGKLR